MPRTETAAIPIGRKTRCRRPMVTTDRVSLRGISTTRKKPTAQLRNNSAEQRYRKTAGLARQSLDQAHRHCARDPYRTDPTPSGTGERHLSTAEILVEQGWLIPLKAHRRDRREWQIVPKTNSQFVFEINSTTATTVATTVATVATAPYRRLQLRRAARRANHMAQTTPTGRLAERPNNPTAPALPAGSPLTSTRSPSRSAKASHRFTLFSLPDNLEIHQRAEPLLQPGPSGSRLHQGQGALRPLAFSGPLVMEQPEVQGFC